jgi:zinc protease
MKSAGRRIGKALRAGATIALLVSISMCLAQSRQSPRRQAPSQHRAPFLENAKLFEETTYVTKVVLKNGLTILVDEYRTDPVVSIQAYVHSGFWNEPANASGLSSLLADMVCRGTDEASAGTFRQQVQTLGGSFSTSTEYENTRFEINAASSQWKKALQIQADAILRPALDQSILAREAKLVTEKARSSLDDPSVYSLEKLLVLGFDQPRMAKRNVLAGGAIVDLARESLVEFHDTAYAPSNMMLVISGDIRSSDILNEAVRIYDMPSRGGPKRAAPPAGIEQEEFRYRAIRGNIPIPRVLMGFHTVSEKSEDFRALEILSAILGSGEGSVLVSRLGDQKGLVFHAGTGLLSYPDFGYLVIQMEVDPGKIDRSEIAAITELELLKREEPSEAEMARAVAQLETTYWKRTETAAGRAEMLAHFESLGDWKRKDRYIAELRQVKPSDVKRVANRYLHLQNCSLLEFLPASGVERTLTAETVLKTLEGLLKPSTDQEQEERSKEMVPAIMIPATTDNFKFSEIQYPFQLASILRGPDMFVREIHTVPVIDLGIFYPSGRLAESKENAGITELMASMMLRGTKDHMGAHFQRQLEIYGGQVLPIVADDYFGFYFSVLSRNFEAGFNLLREAIQSPDFDKDEIGRQKQVQNAMILDGQHSVSNAGELMNQALFRGFSYSLDRYGTEASLAGITGDSLQDWFNTYVKNRKPIVVAIGDTQGTSLASFFVRHFSGSRMQSTKLTEDYVKALEKKEEMEQSWQNSQYLILIGFQAPPENDEDEYTTTLLQSFAGGLGRFPQELRDRLGIAVDVSVTYRPRLRGGSLIVRAIAVPGNETEVLKTLREGIEGLSTAPITDRDFRSAINAAVGAYYIRNQVRMVQITGMVENVLAGKSLEQYQNFVPALQQVTGEDLREVAHRILDMDKAVILQMHGQSKW